MAGKWLDAETYGWKKGDDVFDPTNTKHDKLIPDKSLKQIFCKCTTGC